MHSIKLKVISEYRPGHGWVSYADAGSISNINPNQEYSLVVDVSAQTIRMTVNDVDVLDVVFNRPIEGTGAGLYAWDDAEINFNQTIITGELPRIFVIMPFSERIRYFRREAI